MPIQKIQSLNIYAPKSNKSTTPVKTQVATDSINSQRMMNKINVPYFVSFGSKNSEAKKFPIAFSFDESVRKYFRLKPDNYQTEAAKHIYNNSDTLVLAPTGTGKTLIAEYAINKNLAEGKTTIYTTPLKALSNEKYSDFCKLYGKENVGLLTGEIKINTQAPILIMTTEIYRNMLVGGEKDLADERLNDVASVIYDEFHYMNEAERGEVWETSIMYTPPSIQQILLSATAENGTVLQKWLNRLLGEKSSSRTAEIVDVPADERHVPLKYYIYDAERGNKLHALTEDFYNLERIGKSFTENAKRKLTGKQTEVLADISLKINTKNHLSGEVSPQKGFEYLNKNLPSSGSIADIEKLLVENLDYSQPEAERTAAILADKASCRLNKALQMSMGPKSADKPVRTKEEKEAFFRKNKPEKIITVKKVQSYIKNKKMNHDQTHALKKLSWCLKGNGTADDGIQQVLKMINNQNMKSNEYKAWLKVLKLSPKDIDAIVDMFTEVKYPPKNQDEFALINVLNAENKLPAIFFRFSKKQCDELRKGFVEKGVSLLSKEEQVQAAAIIKKHLDSGAFLGTDEDGSDLLSGVAVHHAGKMPAYKAMVEELAQNKLLKVVFATSTLGAGINVPAKTVVFTQLTKYSGANAHGEDNVFVTLTPNEFHQMGGRAGRRGKDFIGNVIVKPDKEHGVHRIYKLANAKPDAIISSFKPTYSFIANFIAQDGTLKNLESAVDRSFLQERLESLGEKPYKVKNKIKKDFIAMAKVLTDEETSCFVEEDGKLFPTTKGKIVAKARGIDGLLFSEVLYKAGLEYLTPAEMASVAGVLTPADSRNLNDNPHLPEMVADTVGGIDIINGTLNDIQAFYKANNPSVVLNRMVAQYMWQWADMVAENAEKAPNEQTETRELWSSLIKQNSAKNSAFNEGDFLKSVNNTVDILEQIKEVAQFAYKEHSAQNDRKNAEKMKKIFRTAAEALELVKQDPVTYEL